MLKSLRQFCLSALVLLVMCVQSFAVNPDEVLQNPVLENRARVLSAEIRCLVCQNQSIDDSDAQLARDLRVLVREQLVEGKTDEQVLDYLVARYGEFILLKPQISAQNLALWALPFIALLAGLWLIRGMFAKRKVQVQTQEIVPLNDKEQAEIDRLLEK